MENVLLSSSTPHVTLTKLFEVETTIVVYNVWTIPKYEQCDNKLNLRSSKNQ